MEILYRKNIKFQFLAGCMQMRGHTHTQTHIHPPPPQSLERPDLASGNGTRDEEGRDGEEGVNDERTSSHESKIKRKSWKVNMGEFPLKCITAP